ncbi:Hypothetical predicted protein, partial [Marmota monax]
MTITTLSDIDRRQAGDFLTGTLLLKHRTGALEPRRHTGCKGHGWTTPRRGVALDNTPLTSGLVRVARVPGE